MMENAPSSSSLAKMRGETMLKPEKARQFRRLCV